MKSLKEASTQELLNELQFRIECREKQGKSKRYDGLTQEQWERVIELGTLCAFWDEEHSPLMFGLLRGFPHYGCTERLFKSRDKYGWNHCRISTLPGHIRPHFGGERPVDEDADVIVYYKHHRWLYYERAVGVIWSGVVAFIELPEVKL